MIMFHDVVKVGLVLGTNTLSEGLENMLARVEAVMVFVGHIHHPNSPPNTGCLADR